MDEREIPGGRSEIRATLVVRNEAVRLPEILEHHRKLGVDRFFVVDNDSTDGTLDLLLRQPQTHVFFTDRPFRDEKAAWRGVLFDRFCEGHWTLNLDADELFVFPDCEERDLHQLCRSLDEEGAKGMFAPLVDMYAEGELDRTDLRAGASLLETCPLFDGSGYYLRYRRKPYAPVFRLDGGPRLRLLFGGDRRPAPLRGLARWLYRIDRRRPALPLRIPGLGLAIDWIGRLGLPRGGPNMGKVPLLRWSADLGIRTPSLEALHHLEPPIPLSSAWGALLHFKLLSDFRARVREAAAEKLYGPATDDEYLRYDQALRAHRSLRIATPESRGFRSSRSLLEAGLMRRAEGTTEAESGPVRARGRDAPGS